MTKATIFKVFVAVASEQSLARLLKQVASVFGGYTLARGFGGWVDDAGNLVEEQCATIEIIERFSDLTEVSRLSLVRLVTHYLNDTGEQEGLLTEVSAEGVYSTTIRATNKKASDVKVIVSRRNSLIRTLYSGDEDTAIAYWGEVANELGAQIDSINHEAILKDGSVLTILKSA